jgi:cytochrome c oxidase subunit I
MNERLGNIHFWINFVGFNLTFFPMHFSGMLGMSRRIYTYDAGQGWDSYNMASTIGALMLVVATLVFVHNFFWSKKHGAVATSNPWDAATIEWSIPSPPPEHNFDEIPNITSRYPLWDVTHPEMTKGIPHTEEYAGISHVHAAGVEPELRSAHELGIPLPTPTINPFMMALSMVIMISGLLFMHRESKMLALTIIIGGAAAMVGFMYNWLLTPLEAPHGAAHGHGAAHH